MHWRHNHDITTVEPLAKQVIVPAVSGEFPRIALIWQGNQDGFRDYSRAVHLCANAEYMVMNPFSSLYGDYRTNVNAAVAVNPDFKAIRYINPLENQQSSEATELTALGLLDNPNRGGSDTADDGVMRNSSGGEVGTGFGGTPAAGGNIGTNVTDYITPYAGTPASGESDRTKPRTSERGIDYAVRAEYWKNIDPIDDFCTGGFFDVSTRDDINVSPSRGDYDNSGTNRKIPDSEWQAAIARQASLMFGESLEGNSDTAPLLDDLSSGGRSDGRPWYVADDTPLVSMNGIDWESDGVSSNGLTETNTWLGGGAAPSIATPLVDAAHGNLVEFAFGGSASETWMGGMNENGVTNTLGGSFPNSADIVMGMAFLRDRHTKTYSVTNRSMISIECRARNYFAGSHFFILALMSGHCSNMRDDSGFATGFNFIPFELDEQVGEDVSLLNASQIAALKGWMGDAVSPLWPDLIKTDGVSITSTGASNSVQDSGPVWVFEMDNAIALAIPGRTWYKNDFHGVGDAGATPTGAYNLNEVVSVDMTLFPPGAGKKWQRINGAQQSSWNDGSDVGSSITLGTTSQDVNQNSIILIRADV